MGSLPPLPSRSVELFDVKMQITMHLGESKCFGHFLQGFPDPKRSPTVEERKSVDCDITKSMTCTQICKYINICIYFHINTFLQKNMYIYKYTSYIYTVI